MRGEHSLGKNYNCPIDSSDGYLDLKALSGYSCLAVPTLRDYLKEGLPYFKLKGKVLVKRSEFDSWVEAFRVDRNKELNSIVQRAIASLSE